MKKEIINAPAKKRTSSNNAKKGPSFGVLAACIGIMIATVMQGVKKDKEEAAKKESLDGEDANL